MATPHISGLVSVMLSRNPTFAQIINILQSTSTPLNPSTWCVVNGE